MTRTTTTLRFALLLTAANGFLDAYTYLARGGGFANVQTGNVIFFTLEMSHGKPVNALAHVWPILAFATRVWSVPAIWLPAAVLVVTLVLFVVDERKGIEP